jgi:hypothetical protein
MDDSRRASERFRFRIPAPATAFRVGANILDAKKPDSSRCAHGDSESTVESSGPDRRWRHVRLARCLSFREQ